MGLFTRTDELGKKMRWFDWSLFKLAMIFWTLFIITVIPSLGSWLLGFEWYIHLIIAFVLTVPLWKKYFSN